METNLLVPCAGDGLGVQLIGEQRRGAAASDHEDEQPLRSIRDVLWGEERDAGP